jgi:hypothetical protein
LKYAHSLYRPFSGHIVRAGPIRFPRFRSRIGVLESTGACKAPLFFPDF